MNLKFEQLAKKILGEGTSDEHRYDQRSPHSLFSKEEKDAERGHGAGPSKKPTMGFIVKKGDKIIKQFVGPGAERRADAYVKAIKEKDPSSHVRVLPQMIHG